MIKIVSGIDPKEGGHNPTIWSSHNKTEDFMSKGILSANAKSAAENAEFYTIQFFCDYYLFSKHKIVRDKQGDDRMGVISFSLALFIGEKNDILDDLQSLQFDYESDKLDYNLTENDKQSAILDSKQEKKKKKKQEQEPETVYLYYKNEEELKEYFKLNFGYRKYKRIFFIDEKYKKGQGQGERNPINSIHYSKEITVEELKKQEKKQENRIVYICYQDSAALKKHLKYISDHKRFKCIIFIDEKEKNNYLNLTPDLKECTFEELQDSGSEQKKETVYIIYYKENTEINKYWQRTSDCKKISRIIFIDEEKREKIENSLKSTKSNSEITFKELKIDEQETVFPKITLEELNANILKSFFQKRWAIYSLVGLICLLLGGFIGFANKGSVTKEEYDTQIEEFVTKTKSNEELDKKNKEQIQALQDSIKNIFEYNEVTPKKTGAARERSQNSATINGGSGNSNQGNTTISNALQTDEIETFLKTGCKDKTLDQITKELKKMNPQRKNSKLNRFGNFLEVLKNKIDLATFENANIRNFNDEYEYEYVKFFKYLKSNNKKLKSIEGINTKTLEQIKKEYL